MDSHCLINSVVTSKTTNMILKVRLMTINQLFWSSSFKYSISWVKYLMNLFQKANRKYRKSNISKTTCML